MKLYQKDLLETDVDAIVNAANEKLSHGAGVAKTIAKNAGANMDKECKDYIKKISLLVTKALATGAGNLKFKKIIHAAGPAWADYTKKEKCLCDLAKTITNLLEKAKECRLKTVAMPTISSGIFSVPKYLSAAMYLKGVFDFSKKEKFGLLRELHIVDLSSEVLDLIKEHYQIFFSMENALDPKRLLGVYYKEEERKTDKGSLKCTKTQKSPESHAATSMRGPQTKCFTKMYNNVCVYIYTHDIGSLKDIDVAVSCENPYFTGKGGIAATLLSKGGKGYTKEHSDLNTPFAHYATAITPGYETNFKIICHAVVVAFSGTNPLSKECYKQYKRCIGLILNEIDILTEQSVKTKKKKGFHSIALPLLGAGKLQDPKSIQILCSLMMEGIETYASNQTKSHRKHLAQIHLVNMRSEFTNMLITTCSKKNPERQIKGVGGANGTSFKFDSRPFEFLYSWKVQPVKQMVEFKDFIKPTDGQRDGVCIICLDDMSKPVELIKCHHCFCKECIIGYLSEKPTCPVCNTVYGKIFGFQPLNGEAKIFKDKRSLPGYPKTDTLIISYEFANGRQESQGNLTPGYNDRPTSLITKRARRFHLLEQAFKQRLVFTIGLSRTTGKDGVVTWNDIHHKTSREGGPERFGYPDPDYLSRVKEELKVKGITQLS